MALGEANIGITVTRGLLLLLFPLFVLTPSSSSIHIFCAPAGEISDLRKVQTCGIATIRGGGRMPGQGKAARSKYIVG